MWVWSSSNKNLSYNFKQNHVYWDNQSLANNKLREYSVKLFLDFNKFPFKICNEAWAASVDKTLSKGTQSEFDYNLNKANTLLGDFLKSNAQYFKLIVYSGVIPTSSWPNRSYVKIILRLPTNALDIFSLMSFSNLTEFGENHLEDVKNEFCRIVKGGDYHISKLYSNKKLREDLVRLAENNVRKVMGLKNVGDAYVNETLLANLIKKIFPDTIRQYRPRWLGKYTLDIFIPSQNIAMEYNGIQHYESVNRFGGTEKLQKQKERDEFVRKKCAEYNINLLEWHYETKVTEKSVYELLATYVDLKSYKKQLTLFD